MKPEADSFERDPALERAWRAHSAEAPPPEIDRAILAAAHRAVGSAPQDASKTTAEARRPQRWWMPLAAAATIGVIAIGILQLTPQEQSLVLSDERVAAVARRDAEAQKPGPAVGKTADDAAKERDGSTGMRSPTIVAPSGSDTPEFRQKKKQEAKPEASGAAHAPSSPSLPTAPLERENKIAGGKLAAPEPQPFPAATGSQKETFADMKRDRSGAGGASNSQNALSQARTATTQAAPAATVEERAAPRKDVADERQQRASAVTDKATASAKSARPASTSEGAVSSLASTPAPPAALAAASPASPSAAPPAPPLAASPPGASPTRMLAKKVASLDELRAYARDPEAWIVRIRKLRDEGNTVEALREVREFRNLVPDADRRLPADLLEWADASKP